MTDSESFFGLSPERVLQSVEAAGHRPTGHCFTLNALENRVYDVRVDEDRHLVAKFYRPGRWSRAAILEEHGMLLALERAEIPVCVPLVLEGGETLGDADGIHFAIWPRTGGRSPDELDDEQIRVLGRLLARIHDVGEALRPSARTRLDAESMPLAALSLLESRGFLPPSCAARYRAAILEIVALYDAWAEGVPVHPIHGDCHMGNLLLGDAGFFFLDFDDMLVGPAVHDVWMLLPGRDAEADRQRRILVDAYRTFRPFEESWLRLVEPLRAFRFVWYAGWIAKRWTDPAFPDAFPHFGSEAYWEGETRDLEDLLSLIRRGATPEPAGEQVPAADAEPELTNKDFFWDL
jgi:Ser/Thr protein kinase RdoA (MazF antagonist)